MLYNLSGMKALDAWSRVAGAYTRLTIASAEVIARRSAMIAQGSMSAPEAAQMMLEKPAAFATSAQRAMVAAVQGRDAAAITSAALRPLKTTAAANARRLRH